MAGQWDWQLDPRLILSHLLCSAKIRVLAVSAANASSFSSRYLIHTPFMLCCCLICSASKSPFPLLLKSFLLRFFHCFAGQTETSILLHETWSDGSILLSSPNQSLLQFWPWYYQKVALFGCECQGSCLPLHMLLWFYFYHPSCCLKRVSKSTGTKCGWGLI